jgi:hypothetical protein
VADANQVFGIYGASHQAEMAAEELIGAGFEAFAITVLFHDNQTSRDFARRKNTRPPRGTDHGKDAGVPLQGTWGLLEPATGPIQGALEGALAGMGVPDEWPHGSVPYGKALLSVECGNTEDVVRAKEILSRAGAEETGSSVLEEIDSNNPAGLAQSKADARF